MNALETLIEDCPDIDYTTARDTLLAGVDFPSERGDLPENFIAELRDDVFARLDSLAFSYHNSDHTRAVEDRTLKLVSALCHTIDDSRKKLLQIAAIIHDDDRALHTYRQLMDNVDGMGMSNEEWASVRFIARVRQSHLRPLFTLGDVEFVEGLVLATSFAQGDRSRLPVGYEDLLHRNYAPYSTEQVLLMLADVGAFVNGFEAWAEEGLNVLREKPEHEIPATVDDWLNHIEGFAHYIGSLLSKLHQKIADEGYFGYAFLSNKLTSIFARIQALKEKPDHPDRQKYSEALEEIRAKAHRVSDQLII